MITKENPIAFQNAQKMLNQLKSNQVLDIYDSPEEIIQHCNKIRNLLFKSKKKLIDLGITEEDFKVLKTNAISSKSMAFNGKRTIKIKEYSFL